ncbi:DUF5134 domain-containing protein [Nocardia australiensis]|uniref:DUF5134 domain-containing protein n=1 Tax=Nocardia australiensis TaxID=2887191 RepID=UPI001D140CF3|nr:DUF5134 domain-containing protein [Nocardia australiensis]
MTEFVQEYAALRWTVVVAFLFASAIVVARLTAPVFAAEYSSPQADSSGSVDEVGAYHESDAAHLIMCLVMLAMLVFPAEANQHALHGVLTAMTVVFAVLLVGRIVEWHNNGRMLRADRVVALGYHAVAAVAMLYAMSGHGAGGQGGPAKGPAIVLASLFIADALAVVVAVSAGYRHHWLGHPIGARSNPYSGAAMTAALVPHVVMDLGTAYMLIAVICG